MDSFTNLLAKQTARTHPIIIADGVSSARSRPYPIFIMPPGPLYTSAPLYTIFKGAADRTSSLFSRHPASTGYRCLADTGHYPNWIYQSCSILACAIWIRIFKFRLLKNSTPKIGGIFFFFLANLRIRVRVVEMFVICRELRKIFCNLHSIS